AGMTVGTAAYMAPEQALGGEVDARADIWGFGVTTFEMLVGRLPFAAESEASMLLAVTTKPVPRVRDAPPHVPEPLAALVDAALEKDPARRSVTASDIASRIAAWQGGSSAAGVPVATAAPATSRWWKLVAALAVAGAIATGAWFYRQNA